MITTSIYFLLSLISIGAVAGAVLISNYLRRSYPAEYIDSYFYYIILMCVFGIYGIWGSVFVKNTIEQITISNSIIQIISQSIPYLGFPFLIMAWYMFLKFCYELSGMKISGIVTIVYFFLLMIFFVGLGWSIIGLTPDKLAIPGIELIYILVILDMILTLWGLMVLMFSKNKNTGTRSGLVILKFVLLSFLFAVLKVGSVFIFYFFPITIPLFILIYFLSVIIPLSYFYYKIDAIITLNNDHTMSSSFENLIARYGITRREREVIEQVCSGKSNQEIADTLYISLQTVKDHTHRIYLKMDIKSRVQLIKKMQMK